MYRQHPVCKPPPADSVLWRYMDLTKFVSLLQTRSLYFCRADLFEDRFEGSWPRAAWENRAESLGPDITGASVAIPHKEMPSNTAMNCWSESEYESAALWSLFALKDAGIAIRSTFGQMCRAFNDGGPTVRISRVTYLDYENEPFETGHLLLPFLYKRKSFEHEREVRALIQYLPDRTIKVERFPRGGLRVPVSLERLIERIYVSPTAPPWFADLVRELSKHYGLSKEVHQSTLDGDPLF